MVQTTRVLIKMYKTADCEQYQQTFRSSKPQLRVAIASGQQFTTASN